MAVAALVLGIIAICLACIPVVGIFALLPGILSFIFSLVSIAKKDNNTKGMSITGLVLSIFSFLIIIFWIIVLSFLVQLGFSDDFDFFKYYSYYENENFDYDKSLHSVYSMKEDIKLNDRIIKVEKVEKSQGFENYMPSENNEFVLVTVSMKNISVSDILYDCNDFKLIDDKNEEYETDYNKIVSKTTFTKDNLQKNKVVSGVLCFEIPKESKDLTLQYENICNYINISLK